MTTAVGGLLLVDGGKAMYRRVWDSLFDSTDFDFDNNVGPINRPESLNPILHVHLGFTGRRPR